MRVKVSIRLPADIVRAIDALHPGNRSRFIETACIDALQRAAREAQQKTGLEDVNQELIDILLDHVQADDSGTMIEKPIDEK
jgi:hypothetical protein